jgi:hypothetical protein
MRICFPERLLLTFGLGASTVAITMNVIAIFKTQLRRAAQLSSILGSHLPGISALPIELWSLIIEYVVVEQLGGDTRLQCLELPTILKIRLVCRQCTNFTARGGGLTVTRAIR